MKQSSRAQSPLIGSFFEKCSRPWYLTATNTLGLETIDFLWDIYYCVTNDCDHAWALRVLENSAGTLKTLKNLPRWLVPCPEPLRSAINLQLLTVHTDVSSLSDEAPVGLVDKAQESRYLDSSTSSQVAVLRVTGSPSGQNAILPTNNSLPSEIYFSAGL